MKKLNLYINRKEAIVSDETMWSVRGIRIHRDEDQVTPAGTPAARW